MENSIAAEIIQGLVRNKTQIVIEDAALKIMSIQGTVSHICFTFCRLCVQLLQLREEYGEEPFSYALKVLGIDPVLFQDLVRKMQEFGSLPPETFQRVLKQVAESTLRNLEVSL